jgi:PAT family beta-lactamase induction signal transducer AmpG
MISKLKTFFKEFAELYFSRKMASIGILGYGSGIPFTLIFITYTFNLAEKGVNLKDIGLFGLAGLPFAIKFVWSPLVDGLKIPLLSRLGQRRSWLILSQVVLAFVICRFGFLDPATDMKTVVYMAVFLSFVSATYDIAYDAIRVELLSSDKQGAGAGVSIIGYRIGMLVSGGLALFLADIYSWKISFIVIGSSMLICIIATLLTREPEKDLGEIVGENSFAKWLKMFMLDPFVKFIQENKNWLAIILFVIFYKIGDALLGKMVNPFYQQMGFTKSEVALIIKVFGFAVTIIGGLIGGWAVYKLGMLRSLLIFGVLQAVSNFTYIWLANIGHNINVLTIVIIIDNLAGAMGTAAFSAYLSSLCNIRFTATQYALLTSFMSLGRWFTNAPSGYLVDKTNGLGLSWEAYFIITVAISIPGLILIKYLKINDKTMPDRSQIKDLDD